MEETESVFISNDCSNLKISNNEYNNQKKLKCSKVEADFKKKEGTIKNLSKENENIKIVGKIFEKAKTSEKIDEKSIEKMGSDNVINTHKNILCTHKIILYIV